MDLVDLDTRDLRIMTGLLEDYVTQMDEKNHSPVYVEDYITAVKSWLRYFDIEIRHKMRVKNPDYATTLQNESA